MALPPNRPGFAPLYPDLNDIQNNNNNRSGGFHPGYPPTAPYAAPSAPPTAPYAAPQPPYPTSQTGYMPPAPPLNYPAQPGYPDPGNNMHPGYVPPPPPTTYPAQPGYAPPPPPPPTGYPAPPAYHTQPGAPGQQQNRSGGILGDIGSALTAGGVGAAIGSATSGIFGKKHKKQHGHQRSSGPGLGTALGIGAGALAAGALLKHANPFKKVSKMFDYSSSSDSD